MKIEIWFQKSSQPIIYADARTTYQKGSFFCVETEDKRIKYPIDHLFCVKESEFISSQEKNNE